MSKNTQSTPLRSIKKPKSAPVPKHLEHINFWAIDIGATSHFVAVPEGCDEKTVRGRKTDVIDCQWIQQLHTYGLLNGAFPPSFRKDVA